MPYIQNDRELEGKVRDESPGSAGIVRREIIRDVVAALHLSLTASRGSGA